MAVVVYKKNTKLSDHFYSNEFKCSVCDEVRIESRLIVKLEELFAFLNASKCIVSSGYRERNYDIRMNCFAGRHSEGLAVDCCFYDKDNKIIPSVIVCVAAFEVGFPGIARINDNYVHLDVRINGTYYGDETRGNSSYWTDPYNYFNVTRSDLDKYTNALNNIKYQVYTNRWLPEVSGRSDYAGYSNNQAITDIAIEDAVYRVHVKGGNWLGWVSGYNIGDSKNGYAGNGKIIDAIEIRE